VKAVKIRLLSLSVFRFDYFSNSEFFLHPFFKENKTMSEKEDMTYPEKYLDEQKEKRKIATYARNSKLNQARDEEYNATLKELHKMACNNEMPESFTPTQLRALGRFCLAEYYKHVKHHKLLETFIELSKILHADDPRAKIEEFIQEASAPYKPQLPCDPAIWPDTDVFWYNGISNEDTQLLFEQLRKYT
jgi:hypothetical protein